MSLLYKKCTKCTSLKELSGFNKSLRAKDGLQSWCISCKAENYRNNRKNILSTMKEEYWKDVKKSREKLKKYRNNNPEIIRQQKKREYEKHKDKIKKRIRKNEVRRYKEDPNFRILKNIRRRIGFYLNGMYKKSKRSKELLGCSVDYLKNYLSCKFENGMTWENYGEWHIDHIKPCSSFDFSDPKQQEQCFHYSNLQHPI
jgi:hypothetical protein